MAMLIILFFKIRNGLHNDWYDEFAMDLMKPFWILNILIRSYEFPWNITSYCRIDCCTYVKCTILWLDRKWHFSVFLMYKEWGQPVSKILNMELPVENFVNSHNQKGTRVYKLHITPVCIITIFKEMSRGKKNCIHFTLIK